MTTSDVQDNAIPAPADTPVEADVDTERTYPMSRAGRRQAILLLLGVASIWIFALWTLITILEGGIGGVEWVSLLLMAAILVVAPVAAWTFLEEANSKVTTSDHGISYRTLGGINLTYKWEEVQGFKGKEGRSRLARFFLGDDDNVTDKDAKDFEGGTPASGAAPEAIPAETAELDTAANAQAEMAQSPEATAQSDAAPDDDEEPDTLLLRVRDSNASQITNPLIRFLHTQAHGPYLPIYGGLENRRQLLDEIASHIRVKRET
jgi:hypothetical protein